MSRRAEEQDQARGRGGPEGLPSGGNGGARRALAAQQHTGPHVTSVGLYNHTSLGSEIKYKAFHHTWETPTWPWNTCCFHAD